MNGIGNLGAPGQSTGGAMGQLKQAIEQVSTGKKLNSASDNAAGIAIAVEMTSNLGGLRQANRNVGDALSAVRTAEGGVEGVSDALVRMRELSVQAGNSTLNDSQRGIIQTELDSLAESMNQISETTEFNGTSLLDGSTPTLNFQVGPNATSADQLTVDLQDVGASALGVDALSTATEASSMAGVTAIDNALDNLGEFRASLGGAANQLEATGDNLRTSILQASSSLSQVQDTDLGEASSVLASQSVLQQAQISVQVQANATQQSVLRLLG